MEAFKIENFCRTYPSRQFPAFRALDSEQAAKIRRDLQLRLGLSTNAVGLSLVQLISRLQTRYSPANAAIDGFCLNSTLKGLAISPDEHVCINWYQFDNIDIIRFADLAAYFDDIWYPGSDDIDIFDMSLSWIVSVSHEGNISSVILGLSV